LYANFEDKFKDLPRVTVGLVFLGTPFRGTKWQPFAESLTSLMRPAGSYSGVFRDLGFDQPVLRDRLHDFCRLRNTLSTPVACFSELYETDYGRRFGISGVAKGMVCTNHPRPESMLTLQVVEEASACIPGLDRCALQTDHFKINKYAGPTDRSFLKVSETISEMCDNAQDMVRRRHSRMLSRPLGLFIMSISKALLTP